MTITHVTGQAAGANADNTTEVSKAYAGNVAVGNRIVVGLSKYSPSVDAPVVGDVSKSAGTCTVGAWTMDDVRSRNITGTEYIHSAIFSAPVTGAGSCTITVAGGVAGCYWNMGIDEFHSDVGSVDVETAIGTTGNSNAPDSGNRTSAGGAVFVGALGFTSVGAITLTPDAAFSQIYEEENGALHNTGSIIYRIVSTGTTDSASWSSSSSNHWAASVAVYKETASGAASWGGLLSTTWNRLVQ